MKKQNLLQLIKLAALINLTCLVTQIQAETPPYPFPEPTQRWFLTSALSEQYLVGVGINAAEFTSGRLQVNQDLTAPENDYMITQNLSFDITSYTMVVWVRNLDLTQTGGGVMSIVSTEEGVEQFDSITYAEENANQWQMASKDKERNSNVQIEEETNNSQYICMALTVNDTGSNLEIKLYRNGEKLQDYTASNNYQGNRFKKDKTAIVFGIRNVYQDSGTTYETGKIKAYMDHAMLYDYALNEDDIHKLHIAIRPSYCTQALDGYGCTQCANSKNMLPDCTHDRNLYFIADINMNNYKKTYREKTTNQCQVPEDQILNGREATNHGTTLADGIMPYTTKTAMFFDGVSAYRDWGETTIGGEMSLSFWVKYEELRGNARIMDFGDYLTGGDLYEIVIQSPGSDATKLVSNIFLQEATSTDQNLHYTEANVVEVDVWIQITIVWDNNGEPTFYKNGEEIPLGTVASDDQKIITTFTRPNGYIGKSNWDHDSDPFLYATLDEVRIYDRKLSDNEAKCMGNQYAYCSFECGSCEVGKPNVCVSCSDMNRDINDSCKCKDGFYSIGKNPECQSIDCQAPHDYIFSGSDSTLQGPAINSVGPGPMPGSTDTAFNFNGVDQYREFTGLPNIGGEMTYTFWAKWDAFNQYSRIVDIGNGETDQPISIGNISTDNIFTSSFSQSTTLNQNIYTNDMTINAGEWNHYSVIYNSDGSITSYQNGILLEVDESKGKHLVNAAPDVVARSSAYLGKSQFALDSLFQGSIAHFKMFDRPLSQNEIICSSNINSECNRQCVTCSSTPSNCDSCIGENRDISNGCDCKEGYYDSGDNDCASIFPCATSKTYFTVLSIDNNLGESDGIYFGFNFAEVDEILGRTDWDQQFFKLTNRRTGYQENNRNAVEISQLLFRNTLTGQTSGDSYGYQNIKNQSKDNERNFQVGDKLDFQFFGICKTCQGQNRSPPFCNCEEGFYSDPNSDDCLSISPCATNANKIKIQSNEHGNGSVGLYFHYFREDVNRILGRTNWYSEEFNVFHKGNPQNENNRITIVAWANPNGGSVGDGHGRPIRNYPGFYNENFHAGEYFIFPEVHNCIKCTDEKRSLPKCECQYGWKENPSTKKCVVEIPQTCENFVNLEAKSASSDYIKFQLNGEDIPLLQNTESNYRGISFVEINQNDMSIGNKEIFDPKLVPGDLSDMIDYISSIPAQRIVLVGIANTVCDTASTLDQTGIDALQLLGASPGLEINGDSSYVLIGIKGAKPGSRPEMYSDKEPMIDGSTPIFDTIQTEVEAFISQCLPLTNDLNVGIYHDCKNLEQVTLFEGVNAWNDKIGSPDNFKYYNIYEPLIGASYFQGQYELLPGTLSCTYYLDSMVQVYIMHEGDSIQYRHGMVGQKLFNDGWTKIDNESHNMKWLNNVSNVYSKMEIYTKTITSGSFEFPQIETVQFTGGVAVIPLECHESCSGCSGLTEKDCVSCKIEDFRKLDELTGMCVCMSSYFEISGQNMCQECHHSCVTCNGPSASDCLSCSQLYEDQRQLNNGKCDCAEKFFDNGSSSTCQACDQSCLSCSGPLASDCEQQCNPGCESCIQKSELCIQCKVGFKRLLIPPLCGCSEGYYDNGEDLDCQSCSTNGIDCKSCDSSGLCLKCANQNLLPPFCIDSVKINGSYTVITESGDMVQKVCDIQCEVCSQESSNCSQCKNGLNRNNNLPFCSCKTGYHDESGTLIDCIKCQEGCLSCNSKSVCTQCEVGQNRYVNNYTGQCDCLPGYGIHDKNSGNQGQCMPCYEFQGECIQECPEYTYQDENIRICVEKKLESDSNVTILYVGGMFVVVILLLASFGILHALKSNITQMGSIMDQRSSEDVNDKQLQEPKKVDSLDNESQSQQKQM